MQANVPLFVGTRVAGPKRRVIVEWTRQSRGEAWLSWSVGGNSSHSGIIFPFEIYNSING